MCVCVLSKILTYIIFIARILNDAWTYKCKYMRRVVCMSHTHQFLEEENVVHLHYSQKQMIQTNHLIKSKIVPVWCRCEPLVSRQCVHPISLVHCSSGVGLHIRSTLLLSHRHAQYSSSFIFDSCITRVV
jgi:hypothetical protein